jgi:enolase
LNTINRVIAREVLDSRGNPTVEAEVHTRGGAWGRAIVPSGASTGAAEACELRDRSAARYDGRGVLQAVGHVRDTIAPAVSGLDPVDQMALDARLLTLDDSPRKSRLGANALLAVSLAAAHAGAAVKGAPLYRHLNDVFSQMDPRAPRPRMPLAMINMISGGLHAGGNLDFQDFLIMPVGAETMAIGLEWSVRVYRRLGSLLTAAGFEGRLVGDEGGYGPRLASNGQAAEFVVRAIEAAGRFPITSIEDGLAEDDWSGWQQLTTRLGQEIRLVGDDLFTTNAARLERGVQLGAGNSVLIKVNQIGTLTETLETISLARKHGYSYIVSARSGETEDTTIADLAVATAADLIKIGSITRSERLAKYNQLLRIAEELD